MNITYGEVLELDWADMVAFSEMLGEQRAAEAEAIRRASKAR